jgi:hypothetical protein
MKLDRSHEKALDAKGLTPDEVARFKALKKSLGFKNSSQLVNYLLDKHEHNYRPTDNGAV